MSGSNKFSKNTKLFMSTSLIVSAAIVPFSSSFVEAKFVDVSGNTHETAINALAERNLLKGYSNDIFKPYEQLTRSHVVKIIGRYLVEEENLRIPSDYKTNIRFADLKNSQDDELLRYAAVVADSNIFIGSNGNLNPGSYITREQIALVVMRMFDKHFNINSSGYVKAQPNFETAITDLNSADPGAVDAINMIDYFDITVVKEYQPKTYTGRGQFASFIYRLLQKMSEPRLEPTLEEYKQQVLIQPNLLEVNTDEKALVGTDAKPGASITAKDANGVILGSTTVNANGAYTIPLKVDENTKGPITIEAAHPDVGSTAMSYTEINISDLASDVGQNDNPGSGGSTPGGGDTPGGSTPGDGSTPGGGDTPGGSTPGDGGNPGGENPGDGGTPGDGEDPGGENPGDGGTPGEGENPGGENPGDGGTPGEGENPGGEDPGDGGNPDEEAPSTVDTLDLENALAQAETIERARVSEDGSDVPATDEWTTQEALDTFTTAIENAEAVLANEEATQEEVNAAVSALTEAINTYKEAKQPGVQTEEEELRVDTAALENALAQAETVERATVSEDGSDVPATEEWTTQEALDTFTAAIENAEAVLANEEATQEEVDAAVAALTEAIDKYNAAKQAGSQEEGEESPVDTSALEELIAEAATVQVNVSTDGRDVSSSEEWTTKDVFDTFTTAVNEAQVVLDNEEATQEEVNAAVTALTEAIAAYNTAKQAGTQEEEEESPVDTSALEELITQATAARVDVSTDGSDVPITKEWTTQEDFDAFYAALTEVEALLEREDATQEEVNAAAENLRAAINAYNNAKQPGTQTEEDLSASKEDLQNLITDAEEVDRATVSENGSGLAPDEQWTTQEELNSFESAIDNAREAVNNENVTRAEIERATMLLRLAIERYNNAKQQSTQTLRSEYEVNEITLNNGEAESSEGLGDIQKGNRDLKFTTLGVTLSPVLSTDVLSSPDIGAGFVVEEGKEFKFNVRAIVSGVVGTGRLGLAVYKKTDQGYERVWNDNLDYLTLLGIPIQNKYNFETSYFGEGEYKFVTSPDSNFNLDLLSGDAIRFTDTTLRDTTAGTPDKETPQRQGTVTFTEGAAISQVRSMTNDNAAPVEIEDETTVVVGKYGALTINPATGAYTYTSYGDPASIGKLDEFEYTVTGEGTEPVTNKIVILTTSASGTSAAASLPSNADTLNVSNAAGAFNSTSTLLPLRYTLLEDMAAAETVDYSGLN
ncbi:S-layer homology domain-containing protein [Lysinibacillus odysseyi]|uniref:SLH domain-containing protein n=1 Tax=Lysinibacillus odysseyi 34hs-1 = NBRC 100172 TaxID=1220589 RepID=A0A0A3IGT2_9BACI|nr:S-layer homology domain-containing protein [Lysinibacillus odysseyi]KGR83934.1 hypothetical protein CD32_14680 [Lysinibacillus odysseyi 34hs-1 = NBRC 100172]